MKLGLPQPCDALNIQRGKNAGKGWVTVGRSGNQTLEIKLLECCNNATPPKSIYRSHGWRDGELEKKEHKNVGVRKCEKLSWLMCVNRICMTRRIVVFFSFFFSLLKIEWVQSIEMVFVEFTGVLITKVSLITE